MGNLLGSPVTEKETHTGCTQDGDLMFGISSMQGWRIHMEDAHICQTYLYAEELIAGSQSKAMEGEDSNSESGGENCQNKKAKKNVSPEEDPIDDAQENESESDDKNGSNILSKSSSSSKLYRKIPLPGHSLYAVFDGHGGSFAAEYSGLNFCRVLSRQQTFVQYSQYVHDQAERDASNDSSITPAKQAQYHREGLEFLETALRDAFVEIDREILREVHDLGNDDSNTPYGYDEYDAMGTKKEGTGISGDEGTCADNLNGNLSINSHATQLRHPKPLPQNEEDSGTTAVVVIVTPQWIVCANAGDSRAVYSKNNHRAVPLSYDHKPDDEEEERRIRDAGGFVAGGRVEGDLAVSRGLGDFRFKEADTVIAGIASYNSAPEMNGTTSSSRKKKREEGAMIIPDDQKVSPVPDIVVQNRNAEQDEFIIVACDGIWDVQSNHECVSMIADIFNEGESDLGLICEEVLDLCLTMGSKDNMTALIVKMNAQNIGEGGGVKARRELREEAAKTEEEEQRKSREEMFQSSPAYS